MWINRSKWEAINKRLDDLEKKIPGTPYSEPLTFTVYDETVRKSYASAGICDWYRMVPKQEITVKDAIERILKHLGVELTYVAGTPATVVMQKKGKA